MAASAEYSKLVFQVLSWTSGDSDACKPEDGSDQEDPMQTDQQQEEVVYRVGMFGKTADGQSVYLQSDFEPYFFVEVPRGKSSRVILSQLQDELKEGSLVAHKCEPVQRIKLFGFTNGEQKVFLRVVCANFKAFKLAAWVCTNKLHIQTYESNVDPMLRFMHDAELSAAGWVCVEEDALDDLEDETTVCDLEYSCDFSSIHPSSQTGVAPLVVASFDIETYSHDDSFPQPEEEANVVFQIATTFQRLGEDGPYLRHLLTLGPCDAIPGVEIDICTEEIDLLAGWSRVLRREQADVVLGYNTSGFDMVSPLLLLCSDMCMGSNAGVIA